MARSTGDHWADQTGSGGGASAKWRADPAVLDTLALALFESGRVDEAIATATELLGLVPPDAETRAGYEATLGGFLQARSEPGAP